MSKRNFLFNLSVNGNWGEWTSYGECSLSCGGGVKQRNRYCNNPASAHGGQDCLLSDGSGNTGKEEGETAVCNAQACPGMSSYMRSYPYSPNTLAPEPIYFRDT